jgi:hypothetical protein
LSTATVFTMCYATQTWGLLRVSFGIASNFRDALRVVISPLPPIPLCTRCFHLLHQTHTLIRTHTHTHTHGHIPLGRVCEGVHQRRGFGKVAGGVLDYLIHRHQAQRIVL